MSPDRTAAPLRVLVTDKRTGKTTTHTARSEDGADQFARSQRAIGRIAVVQPVPVPDETLREVA